MGMRAFYWAWARTAFKPVFGMGDFYASVAGNTVTVISHFVPTWGTSLTALAWQIPIYGLAGAMFLRIVTAPFELWSEQKKRADQNATDRPFDVLQWNKEDVLRLYQAACLWVEQPPPSTSSDPLPIEARPILQRLKRALTSRELSFHDDADGKKWLWTCAQPVAAITGIKASTPVEISNRAEVDRDGLMAYATRLNERPKFLFGDEE